MNVRGPGIPRARLRTYAKVNLYLHVVGLRADGFHELETILHGVSLGDEIEIYETHSGSVEVDMTLGPGVVGDIPSAEENLAYLAAQQLITHGAVHEGVLIRITKQIPIAAGLGGGSGNAAGALVVLNELWEGGHDPERLLEMAGVIGSDVPYCIGGGTALAQSRGERLIKIPGPSDLWFVLGISHEPLRTADVYAAWEGNGPSREPTVSAMTMALGGGDPHEIASLLHNDLEPVAFDLRPELARKKGALVRAGALGACLSGSGPTLFGIADGEAHARTLARRVSDVFDAVAVVRSQPECIERLEPAQKSGR